MLQAGDHQRETLAVVLTVFSSAAEQWHLEVPAVLWLLERIAAGDTTAAEAASMLQQAAQWPGGCCVECERVAESYPEAVRRYLDLLATWQAQQEQITPQPHPYLLNRSLVHAWDCKIPEAPVAPFHPGHLHSYAALYDGYNGDLNRIMDHLWEPTQLCRHITADELNQRLARRNPNARDSRCKRCSPELPGAWNSESSGVPSTR